MNLNVRGQKIKVTPAIKTYIDDKVARLDKYFGDKKVPANVVVRVSGLQEIVEVTIPLPKIILRAEERNEDLYAAIDLVVDKLERLIRKNKTRLSKKFKKDSTTEFDFDAINEIKNITPEKVVKRKIVELKPMDEEEAILQMDLLNHDFFLFNNIDTNTFSVVYRRKDGEFGIIDAK